MTFSCSLMTRDPVVLREPGIELGRWLRMEAGSWWLRTRRFIIDHGAKALVAGVPFKLGNGPLCSDSARKAPGPMGPRRRCFGGSADRVREQLRVAASKVDMMLLLEAGLLARLAPNSLLG